MFKTFLAFVLFAFSVSALAKKPVLYGNVFVDEVMAIYDGDTFYANISGWPAIVGERVSVRINGVDTPEIRTRCASEKKLGQKAKQVTVEMLRSAQKVELRNMQRGKYFRIIADVYADGVSVAETLIAKNLAYEYYGGTRQSWCIDK